MLLGAGCCADIWWQRPVSGNQEPCCLPCNSNADACVMRVGSPACAMLWPGSTVGVPTSIKALRSLRVSTPGQWCGIFHTSLPQFPEALACSRCHKGLQFALEVGAVAPPPPNTLTCPPLPPREQSIGLGWLAASPSSRSDRPSDQRVSL